MQKIMDLFLDDIELILEYLPQGSSITITKEELESDDNLFYIETDNIALLDEIEMLLHNVEKDSDDDDYEDDFDDEDDMLHNLVYEDSLDDKE